MTAAPWIRDKLGIQAEDAEREIVVSDGGIVEIVPRGAESVISAVAVFDAGRHDPSRWATEGSVVEDGAIPGLDIAALVRRHNTAAKVLHAQ